MSRKEDRIWGEGFERACEIAKRDGLDALLKEQRLRGAYGFTPRLTFSDLDLATDEIKHLTFSTMCIACVAVLHDDFGFGGKRVQKFLDGVDKVGKYMDKGWICWLDLIEGIKARLSVDLHVPDGDGHLLTYSRPANKDLYDELIDGALWKERIKALGLTDDGSQVTDPGGRLCWEYKDEYDKVQIYDELGGVLLAVECLGAEKPGQDVNPEPVQTKPKKRRKR